MEGAEPAEWLIPIGAAQVRVRPDLVETRGSTIEIHRFRTGRAPKKAPDDPIYALYHLGAQQAGLTPSVGVHYLGSESISPVAMKDKAIATRAEKYQRAIDGIAKGHFPAIADERNCPRCPQYFVCGAP